MFDQKTIQHLPIEIFVEILSYLKAKDLLEAKLVNQYWLHVINSNRKLFKKLTIIFQNCLLSPEQPPLCIFNRSLSKYETILIGNGIKVQDGVSSIEIWQNIGKNIKAFKFDNKNHPGRVARVFEHLPAIRDIFPNLRYLCFKNLFRCKTSLLFLTEIFGCKPNKIYIKLKFDGFEFPYDEYRQKFLDHRSEIKAVTCVGYYSSHVLKLLHKTNELELEKLHTEVKPEDYGVFMDLIQQQRCLRKLKVEYIDLVPENIRSCTTLIRLTVRQDTVLTREDYLRFFDMIKGLSPHSLVYLSVYGCTRTFHKPIEYGRRFIVSNNRGCSMCLEAFIKSGGVIQEL